MSVLPISIVFRLFTFFHLIVMMQESKLTNLQQRKLKENVQGTQVLRSTCMAGVGGSFALDEELLEANHHVVVMCVHCL